MESPAPTTAPQLLEQPGVDDLLTRFLTRRSASTIEAYCKDLTYFATWLGLPLRKAINRLLACDQGQATGCSTTSSPTCGPRRQRRAPAVTPSGSRRRQ